MTHFTPDNLQKLWTVATEKIYILAYRYAKTNLCKRFWLVCNRSHNLIFYWHNHLPPTGHYWRRDWIHGGKRHRFGWRHADIRLCTCWQAADDDDSRKSWVKETVLRTIDYEIMFSLEYYCMCVCVCVCVSIIMICIYMYNYVCVRCISVL